MNVTWQHFDQSVKGLAVGYTSVFRVAAFVGKPSFADVVKSPARSVVRPLMSRQNLLNQQTVTSSSRYVCFSESPEIFLLNYYYYYARLMASFPGQHG